MSDNSGPMVGVAYLVGSSLEKKLVNKQQNSGEKSLRNLDGGEREKKGGGTLQK